MMAAPSRMLTGAPTTHDIRDTRHVGIEVPDVRKAQIDVFERQPAILLKSPASWFAVWRFLAPVHPDIAGKAEETLAAHFGGKRLNHFLPVPNIGGARLVEFAKDRFVVPTDFRAAPQASTAPEQKRASFSRAANVKAENIPWLWPEVVAKGDLTLVAGQPGMGKSQISVFVAATLSSGGVWPDGTRSEIGSAIICETEDDPASVIRPRLEAAGADLNKIEFGPHLDLTQELETLTAQAESLPDCRLIVLSPFVTFFGPASSDDVTVRARLQPLLDWASKRQIAILGITHLLKQGKGDVFSGSEFLPQAGARGMVRHHR